MTEASDEELKLARTIAQADFIWELGESGVMACSPELTGKAFDEAYDNGKRQKYLHIAQVVKASTTPNPGLREALEGLLAEWDKFARYGSPIAKASNEAVNRARAALRAPQPANVPREEGRADDEHGYFKLGKAFWEEFHRYERDGSFKGFICAASPVEILVHLINERDDALAATRPPLGWQDVGPALDAIEAGAQALANDVWHPPQRLGNLARYEADKFRRQARLVLEALPASQGETAISGPSREAGK